jgi:hypothetical protein
MLFAKINLQADRTLIEPCAEKNLKVTMNIFTTTENS